ncbi:putative RING-H2 finger protein ATL12 [Glycine soja]
MVNCNIICNYPFKNHLPVFINMMVLSFISNVQAQDSTDTDTLPADFPQPVRPSKVVVIVALSILFTFSFLLLLYIRFRRITPLELIQRSSHHSPNFQATTRSNSRSRLSGIDRQVIEALPFFRFSSLKGSKQGLECTVCLSQFEDTEILRLLPKCKHTFHMNCIDKWLESHSSCPLCRNSIDPLDIKNFTYSISSRSLRVPSNLTEDTNLEIFVHRESSSRFNMGSRLWNLGRNNKEERLLDQEVDGKHMHKFNHKIVVSDVVTRSRWSDLNSSDMLSLNSEMLLDMSSRRFSPSNEMIRGDSSLPFIFNDDESSFTLLNTAEKRSMSEIARVPRFIETCKQNRTEAGVASSGSNEREERLRRIWLGIAQRTVQCGAGKRHKWNKAEVDPVRIKRLTWGIETGSGPFATFA